MLDIAIIGAGTWGLALANLLSDKGYFPKVYAHFDYEADRLNKTRAHPRFPGVRLSENISFLHEQDESLKGLDILVLAVPSPFVRESVRSIAPYLDKSTVVVTVSKGLEDGTFLTMSEVMEQELDGNPVVALSGPTHAEEVARRLPTLCVSSSKDVEAAKMVRDVFSSEYFRVYENPDVKGVELSGALKNIIALASGICDGLGYGDNAKAALITRGLNEMIRLGVSLGAKKDTFFGLAGLGDLVVTCSSSHSRNHECGLYIGQGYSVSEAKAKVAMAVEGLNALEAAYHLSKKKGVEMPITHGVYEVVYKGVYPLDAVRALFSRDLKSED